MAIPLASPAVDKADPSTSLSTERGVLRPQGAGVDIGAFEALSTTTWNPNDKAMNIMLSNGDLTFALGSNAYDGVRSVASASAGKKYWELKATTIVSSPLYILEGIVNSSFPVNGANVRISVELCWNWVAGERGSLDQEWGCRYSSRMEPRRRVVICP